VDGAVEAGKIAPAARGFYVGACRAEGGVEKFAAMVAAAPALVAPATPAAKPDGGGAGPHGLNEAEIAVASALGQTAEEYALAKTQTGGNR